jgi:hypothetical protein
VLEAQQKAIDRNPRMPFYNLNIDAGALWARPKIDVLAVPRAAEMPSDDWSHEETDEPLHADPRNFYKLEK